MGNHHGRPGVRHNSRWAFQKRNEALRFEVNLLAGRLSQQRCRELTAISWLDFADQLAVSFWRRLLFAFRGRSMYRDFRVQIAALKEEQHGTLD